jgi:hypothetical protein
VSPAFDDEVAAFLATGCALIVGTVTADGAPFASRGWGVQVLEPDRSAVRLLLAADDRASEHLGGGGRVAVTAASVRTFRAVQLKGRCTAVEPATAEDEALSARYCELFFGDVVETDGTPLWKMERMRPLSLVACVVEVDEAFDQTPGPAAGGALSSRS